MGKRNWAFSIALTAVLLASIVSYQILFAQSPNNNEPEHNNELAAPTPTSTVNSTDAPTNGANATPTTTSNSNVNTADGGSQPIISPTPSPTVTTIPDISTTHEKNHEKASDYLWNSSDVITVLLSGTSISTSAPNSSSIQGSKITITSAGTYKISGTLTNGQIIVDTQDTTRLILSNVDISCSSSSPIYIMNSKKTILVLEENTVNTVRDASTGSTVEPNAAIFSASDLTIFGAGQIDVWGNNNDAIASKDGLIIKSGTINVNSLDDGIRGKDYLIVKDGNIIVTSGGDGLKSDNSIDTTRGYVDLENGIITITSGRDAIEAQSDLTVTGGQYTLTSGGGSGSTISAGSSAKGIKAVINVTITNGTFTINSADDCFHSNRTLTITGGTFALQTGDDAIHADKLITINGGDINVATSYEGIESTDIIINAGTIYITSRDDGINGAGGNDGSGFQPGPGIGGPGGPGQGFVPGNRTLTINGGYIVVSTVFGSDGKDGDGIDINGPITMTGGYVVVNGPTFNGNSAIDWEGSFKMTGGFILGVGSSGMAMTAGPTSTQYALLLNLKNTRPADTLIHIQTTAGTDILTFQASKTFQSIALCSPSLTKFTAYSLYLGGGSTGTLKDGVYQGGVYSGGTLIRNFTISTIVTTLTYL
jgi:hypothetical protein